MAIAHRASAVANSTTNTTSLTVTIPASVQADDLLFLVTSNYGAATNPTVTDNDSGGNTWARIGGSDPNRGSSSSDVYWKRATSGTASKTITVSGCTNSCSAGVSAFSGGRTTDPPYENVTAESNLGGNETQAGFTPTVSGSMVCLAVCNVVNDLAVGSQSSTSPGALTEFFEHLNTGGGSCATNLSGAVQSVAGATGSLTWSQTNSDTGSIGWNILPAGFNVTAESGSYTLTGTSAALTYATEAIVVATSGVYQLTGTDASLLYGVSITMTAEAGSYVLTGTEPTLTYTAIEIVRKSFRMDVQANHNIITNTASPQLIVRGRRP